MLAYLSYFQSDSAEYDEAGNRIVAPPRRYIYTVFD